MELIKPVLVAFALLSLPLSASQTYPIEEPDPLVAIEKRLQTVNVEDYINRDSDTWSVFKGIPYPRVTKTNKRLYVPYYTSPHEIKDAHGKVIYPKGYTFNPLEYAYYPARIVVFKLDQYKAIEPFLRPSDMLIADTGNVMKASYEHKKHIFLVEPDMDKRLGLRALPSFIEQKGTKFEIKEVAFEDLEKAVDASSLNDVVQ